MTSQSSRDEASEPDREPPLNQEPGTAAPQTEADDAGDQADPKSRQERGNEGPEEMPGFGQGA
jgi:hypothetical protein